MFSNSVYDNKRFRILMILFFVFIAILTENISSLALRRTLSTSSHHYKYLKINDVIKTRINLNLKSDDILLTNEIDFGSDFSYVAQTPNNGLDKTSSMSEFESMRQSFMWDSLFACSIGIWVVWYFGNFKDVYSYGFGGVLGLCYAYLMSRYVENLGSGGQGGGGGSARFLPVIILVVAFGKYKEHISLLPELLGFFTYKISSVLQIFNEEAYKKR